MFTSLLLEIKLSLDFLLVKLALFTLVLGLDKVA